jgi:hypothetical protein
LLMHKKIIILICTCLLSLLSLPIPALASADSGLSIVPFESIKADIASGDSIVHKMKLQLGSQDQAMDVAIDVMGYGLSLDGNIQTISPAQDTSLFSSRSFISLSTSSFHLDPGQSNEFDVTVSVPADTANGGMYAIIYIHQQKPTGSGSTGTISAFNIPVLITVKDSNLTHTAKISNVGTSSISSGKPVDILTTFQNTGNHHFKVKGEVTVTDCTGKILDTLYESLTPSSIIPTMSRQLKATFVPDGELPLGTYSLKSKIMLEDGTILDEATGSFEVKAPYVPPPPPASVNLKPSSAATLQTDDGRIIINFPQGAVLGEARVSLQSYPPEQLPSPPTGLTAATTCFRVDGLNGLLTKEAKMTVKYSSADLQKAGGDASKLQLARWDEVSNQWTVLKTSVDKPTMTLTASTNQFSLWAVMVGTPASPATGSPASPANWTLFAVIGGAVVVVIVVILLFIRKRKG